MILFYRCVFGTSLPLGLDERFGSAVELQALEFVNGKPMEWRLTANENAILDAWYRCASDIRIS